MKETIHYVQKPRQYRKPDKHDNPTKRQWRVLGILFIIIISLIIIGMFSSCGKARSYTSQDKNYVTFMDYQIVSINDSYLYYHNDTIWQGNRRAVINWKASKRHTTHMKTDSGTIFRADIAYVFMTSMTIIPADD